MLNVLIAGYLFRLQSSIRFILAFSDGHDQIALDSGKSSAILEKLSMLYRLAEMSDTYRRLSL